MRTRSILLQCVTSFGIVSAFVRHVPLIAPRARLLPLASQLVAKRSTAIHSVSTKVVVPNNDALNYDSESGREGEVLSCRIIGFYPFPTPSSKNNSSNAKTGSSLQQLQLKINYWLFRDTHQAIVIRSSVSKERLIMDFMTEGGDLHPVWWNERMKWNVLLGGTIRGEVRVRKSTRGTDSISSVQLERIETIARAHDCNMNIYRNNCRIFCARMEREVERLNAESSSSSHDHHLLTAAAADNVPSNSNEQHVLSFGTDSYQTKSEWVADSRYVLRAFGAGLLPAIYPLAILWVCLDSFFLHGL